MKVLLLILFYTTQSWGSLHELTLEKSIEIALNNATAVLKSENNFRLAGVQVLQSYAQFLPSLAATGSYALNYGKTSITVGSLTLLDQSRHVANYGLASTLNIFNGLADYASFKSSLERKNAAEFSLVRAKQFITVDVVQSFLQVILDQQVIQISKSNFAASEAREEQFRIQMKVGSNSLADFYRQTAQAKLDQSFLITSQTKLHDDEIGILRKLQLDLNQEYRFIPPNFDSKENPHSIESEKNLIRLALNNRPDFKAEASALGASHWDVSTARSGYYPHLDLGLHLGGGSQFGGQIGYTFGLYLSWSLFDRFVTKLNVERANVNEQNTEIDYQDLKLQVIGEVRQIYGDYKSAREQLRAAKEGAIAAEKAYAVIRGRYSVGASNFIDLLTAQATLTQSKVSLAQSTLNYMLQSRQLDYILGL